MAKRERKPAKGLKSLTAKKLVAKEDSRVKAGYIGDTEKFKSASWNINWGDAQKQ
jgi:hypothetical protein